MTWNADGGAYSLHGLTLVTPKGRFRWAGFRWHVNRFGAKVRLDEFAREGGCRKCGEGFTVAVVFPGGYRQRFFERACRQTEAREPVNVELVADPASTPFKNLSIRMCKPHRWHPVPTQKAVV